MSLRSARLVSTACRCSKVSNASLVRAFTLDLAGATVEWWRRTVVRRKTYHAFKFVKINWEPDGPASNLGPVGIQSSIGDGHTQRSGETPDLVCNDCARLTDSSQ